MLTTVNKPAWIGAVGYCSHSRWSFAASGQ